MPPFAFLSQRRGACFLEIGGELRSQHVQKGKDRKPLIGRKRWARPLLLRFVAELTLTGGAGAVVLVILGNGFFAPMGTFDLVPFLFGLAQYPLIPVMVSLLAFVIGAAFKMVCAVAAAIVAVLLSQWLPVKRSRWIAVGGGLSASVVAALLSQPAAYWSAVPIDLVTGAFVLFNLVTCTLLLRLYTERHARNATEASESPT